MRYALLALALAGCELYTADDVQPPGDEHAIAPDVESAGVGECAPAASDAYACPPYWLSCSRLQLRQSECQTACTTGDRICAGFDAGECFNDCVAYRYEAYCPL